MDLTITLILLAICATWMVPVLIVFAVRDRKSVPSPFARANSFYRNHRTAYNITVGILGCGLMGAMFLSFFE